MRVRLNIGSILFRRLLFLFAKNFCIVILCFFLIAFLLEYVEVSRKFSSHQYRILTCLSLLRAFATFSSLFPFTSFLGTILFFMTVQKRLELIIINGVGVSARQIVGCLLLAVSFISLAYITIIDASSAISINKVKNIEHRLKSGNSATEEMAITNRGIWFRDTSKSKSYIIYAKSFVNETKSLSNVRIFEFNKDNILVSFIFSKSASILNGFWTLQNAKIINTIEKEKVVKTLRIPTTLSFKNIDRITANPKSISFWTMSKYIAIVEKVGLSSLRYKISWLSRMSSIMQMLALTALAFTFCIDYSQKRSRWKNLKLPFLLSLAFPIHFANDVLMAFGENGDIPALIAVFSVPFVVILSCSRIILKE